MVRGHICVLSPILLSDLLCLTMQNTPGRPHFQFQLGFQQGYYLLQKYSWTDCLNLASYFLNFQALPTFLTEETVYLNIKKPEYYLKLNQKIVSAVRGQEKRGTQI